MYLDDHPLAGAFLAHQLTRLADLITDQGEAFLRGNGIEVPSRAVSTVLLIGDQGPISAAAIAEQLQQPHQVTTQRVELLIKAGITDRTTDPEDGRRKLLTLTPHGREQYDSLQSRLKTAAAAFEALFEDIGCDLAAVADRAAMALELEPLSVRASALEDAASPAPAARFSDLSDWAEWPHLTTRKAARHDP